MKRALLLLVSALFAGTGTAFAHPVSFKGGFGLMPEYSPDRSDLELNYSLTASDAIGISTVHADSKDGDVTFVMPRYNYRLYRANALDSQANVYVSGGVGSSIGDDADGAAGLAALQADYETRRIYTLLHLESYQSSSNSDLSMIRYRAGFAPYLGGFDSLHTWFIAQLDYSPDMNDEWTLTPLVRFFYSNYLFEVGASTRGDPFAAAIIHF